MNKPFPFKIGADPEFTIAFEDKAISADRLIATFFRKTHKPDSQDMGFKIGKAGSIGWDGCSSTAEIRPEPSNDPEILVGNIGKLLGAFAEKGRIFKLLTTSNMAPIGGHIHFEIDEKLAQKTQAIDNIHKRLISFYLPVQMGEDVIDVRTRTRNSYGKFTDYRAEGRGYEENSDKYKCYTYEFRVPSAEWLTTPHISKATFCYLATIWNEIIYHPDNFSKSKEILFHTKKQSLALQELAMSQFAMLTKLMLEKIKKHIRNFEYYKEYKDEIDFILSPDKVLAEKKKADFDILTGWKFPEMKEPNKRALLSETKVKAEAKKINIEDLSGLITIPYNPDMNVERFAAALKARMIALNWKLANKYYLFGLRKGVPGYIIMDRDLGIIAGKDVIKTRLDLKEITESFRNIIEKFYHKDGFRPSTTESTKKTLYVGIPYDERINVAIRGFINMIYNIEKRKPVREFIDEHALLNDSNLAAKDQEKLGKIFRAYNDPKISSVVASSVNENARLRVRETEAIRKEEEHENRMEREADQTTDELIRELRPQVPDGTVERISPLPYNAAPFQDAAVTPSASTNPRISSNS